MVQTLFGPLTGASVTLTTHPPFHNNSKVSLHFLFFSFLIFIFNFIHSITIYISMQFVWWIYSTWIHFIPVQLKILHTLLSIKNHPFLCHINTLPLSFSPWFLPHTSSFSRSLPTLCAVSVTIFHDSIYSNLSVSAKEFRLSVYRCHHCTSLNLI